MAWLLFFQYYDNMLYFLFPLFLFVTYILYEVLSSKFSDLEENNKRVSNRMNELENELNEQNEVLEKQKMVSLLKNIEGCDFYDGDLTIHDNSILKDGYIFPKEINGDLWLNLYDKKVILPEKINGSLTVHTSYGFSEVLIPKSIEGDLSITTDRLNGLKLPNKIFYDLIIFLTNTPDQLFSKTDADLDENTNSDFVFPDEIEGDVYISASSISNINLPKCISGRLTICGENSVNNINLPNKVTYLAITSKNLISDIELPTYCHHFDIESKKVVNVILPKKTGSMSRLNINEINGLVLPETQNVPLIIRNLKSINNLIIGDSSKGYSVRFFADDIEVKNLDIQEVSNLYKENRLQNLISGNNHDN